MDLFTVLFAFFKRAGVRMDTQRILSYSVFFFSIGVLGGSNGWEGSGFDKIEKLCIRDSTLTLKKRNST